MVNKTKRTFTSSRRVRVGDCNSDGVIRIDALARYLQDIGYDDTDDIGVGDGGLWVARSIVMEFPKGKLPQRNETVNLETYCGGIGRAFAQRIVNVNPETNNQISTSTIWVSVDDEGKPSAVPDWLKEAYPDAEKANASRKLTLLDIDQIDENYLVISWQLRATDFDINNHVNNAVAFNALYEVAEARGATSPSQVIIEYHQPIDSHHEMKLVSLPRNNGFDAWLMSDKNIAAAMRWSS